MSDLNKITHIAIQIAKDHQHESYGSAHLIKAVLNKDFSLLRTLFNKDVDVYFIDEWATVHLENFPKRNRSNWLPSENEQVSKVLEEAERLKSIDDNKISELLSIFIACLTPDIGFSYDQLKALPVTHLQLISLFEQSSSLPHQEHANLETVLSNPAIKKYTTDLVLEASKGTFDDFTGRDREIKQIAEILNRKSKPHVTIIGESGVGKTTLIQGFAASISDKSTITSLQKATILEINTAKLLTTSSYKGEVEDRLFDIFKAAKNYEKPIIFIDDFHMLLEDKTTGKSLGHVIKSELNSGAMTLITSTTPENYRKLIATDEALERRMVTLNIEAPDDASAFDMLKNHAETYGKHHELTISENGIKTVIQLAKRYLKEKSLPDTAIDLIDRTMSAVKVSNQSLGKDIEALKSNFISLQKNTINKSNREVLETLDAFYHTICYKVHDMVLNLYLDQNYNKTKTVTDKLTYIKALLEKLEHHTQKDVNSISEKDIATMTSILTGIPIGKVQTQEKARLMNMEAILKQRVIGQDNAIKTISDAIIESRSGLSKPGQPIGSFFFSGPTGTGKTELAKTLAEFLFQDENAIIRFDMSEFKEEHAAALLYGAPPGYVGYEEGGVLVNKIREKPYAIVLFDEIEKAHPSVFDVFLQILDEGKLHDRLGKTGEFSNAVILFTSNIGSDYIVKSMEKGQLPSPTQLTEIMSPYFRPEFLGRITEIVPFAPISEKIAVSIFKLHLKKELFNLAEDQGFSLHVSDDTCKYLALNGFSSVYGVRQLKAVIRNRLKRPLSRLIISETFKAPQEIEVVLNQGNIEFNPKVPSEILTEPTL
ncbi:ATP-dependent Clp protease ATP-binding subunit [Tamlana sp. s12]|uniref:AAA family ATPase n=1 Tax=Tamlana sp. s12 TaxID=1630406 RepID=UPI000801600D|nr:ATP-dependent Clp protease ATP-binding subunit [Tamlana sp. s12]OBQ56615.1 ATPase AAA [Tamlana sp. s12]QQY81743.1 ATP-dependent Clp protease ATP-binding subunit [Tamlana sp. s12]